MNSEYIVADYLRISMDDGRFGDSQSIEGQRDLINDYIRSQPDLKNAQLLEFLDDGYSGTNFDRPGVKKMLELVKQGKINCIIVKDFSRFGRSYIDVGDYLEQIFPFLRVRFISVNDGFDSERQECSAGDVGVAFKSLCNDYYSKDLSRKIKSGIKTLRDNGKCLSGVPPFGYKISEHDRYQLAIDEKTAPIVRRIFDMALEGNNAVEIAKALNNDRILTPMGFKLEAYPNRKWNTHTDCNVWNGKIVIKVMREMRYTGTLVQGKLSTPVVGSGKRKMVAKTDWHITPGCHEAIVSQTEYDEVQRLTTRVRKPSPLTDYSNLSSLAGKVRCGGCGYVLAKNHNKIPSYYCRQKRFTESSSCLHKGVAIETVEETILVAIQKLFELISLEQEQQKSLAGKRLSASIDLERQIQALQKEINKINNIKLALYQKYSDGDMSKEEYFLERDSDDKRLQELNSVAFFLEKSRPQIDTIEDNALMGALRNLKYCGKLSREVIEALIDRIFVYDAEHIEIKWEFEDLSTSELLSSKGDFYGTAK